MQSQVLLTNVVMVARRLSREVRSTLLQDASNSTFPQFIRVAAMFTCLSCSRVWKTFKSLSETSWEPVEAGPPRGEAAGTRQDDNGAVLTTLVRAALSESIAGASERAFVKHISRLALDGVHVGGKFHTRAFVRETQFLAAKALEAQDRLDIDRILPGLGIPSSFAVLFDGIPVGGASCWNRHGNVEVVCVAFVSPLTGRIHARFVTWAVSSVGHKGEDMANTILSALSELPLGLDRQVLQRRMAAIGGDGAVVRGGPDRRTPGTRAADLMWLRVFPKTARPPNDDALLGDLVPPAQRPRGDGPRRPRGELEDHWVNEPQMLHSVTEWDKFHREDIALTRAIAACPLAEELYTICALMDNLFGLGNGRLLLRAGAEATGARFRSGRLPGMTRKAVQLCSEPGHLLDNFKAYAVGLHVREAWRAEGHDQKASKLIDAGRRLTSVQLVCFAMAFRDIMSLGVAPWVAAIQKTSLEPWVVYHHWRNHEQRLCATVEALSYFRDFVHILVLLRQWLPACTLVHLTRAVFFAMPSSFFVVTTRSGLPFHPVWGRYIPALVHGVASMLQSSQPRFQGVELICVQEPWQSNYALVGPHCQCAFLRPRKTRGTIAWRGGRLKIKVPLWVSESGHKWKPQPAIDANLGDMAATSSNDALVASVRPPPAGIRWKWVQKDHLRVPKGVPPGARFRPDVRAHASDCSSCILPSTLPQLLLEIDSAMSAAMAFLRKLLHEERQMFGPEGMSASMAKLNQCIARCFDWGRLVRSSPTADDIVAFKEAYELLSPYLRHTEWPNQAEFPNVVHGWPDSRTMQYQYSVLVQRVRLAAVTREAHDWWQVVGFRVVPVVSYLSVIEVIGPAMHHVLTPCGSRQADCFLYRVASVVSSFLGHGLYPTDALVASNVVRTPKSFVVSPAKLARVGFPWKGRQMTGLTKRVVIEKWGVRPAEPGGLATLLLPGSVGKLVYIEACVKDLDWSAVSAAIDCNPHFSRDGPRFGRTRRSRTSTWHAVRVHHQCRMLGVPEACCERTGSAMKRLWGKNPSVSVSALMDLTALAVAGVTCCGSKRDEDLCQAVADSMTHMGRVPNVGRRTEKARERHGVGVSRAVQNFRADAEKALFEEGRGNHFDIESTSSSDEGMQLTDALEASVDNDGIPNFRKRARATAVVVGGRTLSGLEGEISKRLTKGKPAMTLPRTILDTIAAATARGVSSLPLVNLQTGARHELGGSKNSARAPSAVKARLNSWLESDLGKEWKAERDKRVKDALDA